MRSVLIEMDTIDQKYARVVAKLKEEFPEYTIDCSDYDYGAGFGIRVTNQNGERTGVMLERLQTIGGTTQLIENENGEVVEEIGPPYTNKKIGMFMHPDQDRAMQNLINLIRGHFDGLAQRQAAQAQAGN